MASKKKGQAASGKNISSCQDLYEKAMLDMEADRPAGFKRNMGRAIEEAEALLAEAGGENLSSASSSGEQATLSDTAQELVDFIADCCVELGTFIMEENGDDEENCARNSKPYLERAVDLYRGRSNKSKSGCRPAVVALSTAHSLLHEHDRDIALCQEFVRRLTDEYNEWTPLQNDILSALAGGLNNADRLDEAEAVYRKIVSICKTNYGDRDDRTVEAEGDLVQFLEDRSFGVCSCKLTKAKG